MTDSITALVGLNYPEYMADLVNEILLRLGVQPRTMGIKMQGMEGFEHAELYPAGELFEQYFKAATDEEFGLYLLDVNLACSMGEVVTAQDVMPGRRVVDLLEERIKAGTAKVVTFSGRPDVVEMARQHGVPCVDKSIVMPMLGDLVAAPNMRKFAEVYDLGVRYD